MCLDKLSNFKVKLDENGIGVGYKIFHHDVDGLTGEHMRQGKIRPRQKWLKEGEFRKHGTRYLRKIQVFYYEDEYPFGFHIFKTKYGAENWHQYGAIIKVRFRNVVAKGYQSGFRCVIAKEIFIPKEA